MTTNDTTQVMTIVDYGLGNILSIKRALAYLGVKSLITSEPDVVRKAQKLILPGVGAFGDGIQNLRENGLIDPILDFAQSGRPLLGICLGMQLLFDESEEFGEYNGLGLIKGKVQRLLGEGPSGKKVKVPHIGWNALHPSQSTPDWESLVLQGLVDGDEVYFVHSYIPHPEDDSVSIGTMTYGDCDYSVVVEHENVYGVQFHPEKSGIVGLQILQNFIQKCI
jgi:glutamine amidotransferase